MRTKRTRVLHAVGPFILGAGFTGRMILNSGPPITITTQLDTYSYIWSVSLIGFCYGAAACSLFPAREWVLRLGAGLRFALGCWVLAVALIFFFYPEHGIHIWTSRWWHSRDYTLVAAISALAALIFASAWDLIHFHLAGFQLEQSMTTQLEQLQPPGAELEQ